MAKTQSKQPKQDDAPEPRRLAEKAGVGQGGGFEGVEKIDKKDVDGEEVILVDFKFGKSQFKEADAAHPQGYDYVICLIEIDGEQKQVNIGGQVVVEALHKIEATKDADLPAPVVFFKGPTKDGKRTFWSMK